MIISKSYSLEISVISNICKTTCIFLTCAMQGYLFNISDIPHHKAVILNIHGNLSNLHYLSANSMQQFGNTDSSYTATGSW